MKFLYAVLLFLLGMGGANAQTTFRIEGKVLDFHNNTPLSEARITMVNQSTVSAADGSFVLEKIPAGKFTLSAKHPDCEPFEQEINVEAPLFLTIRLEHHVESIEEIQISGVRKPVGAVTVKSLSKEDISRNSSENLGNMLTSISGVNTLKTGNNISKPVIRGLYGSRILIFNNNVRMAEQEWGVEHAPSVDANAFERLRVIKGAGTLKYGGDAIGGVVALEPRNFPAKDTIMGNIIASYISNGKGGNLVADIAKTWENRWFVRTQGSFKKLGDISVPMVTLQNTGAEENAFSFGTGYRSFDRGIEFSYNGIFQEFGIFKGSHLGASEEFYNAVKYGMVYYTGDFTHNISHPKQNVNHHLAKLEAYKRFENFGKLSLQYAFQMNRRKEFDIRRGDYYNLASMDLRLVTHSAKIEHLLEREKWSLESGLNGAVQDNFPNPATKARRLIPDYYRYDAGAFSHFQYHFSPKWKAEIGLRYDLNIYDAYKYYDQSEWEERFAHIFPQFEVQESNSRILTRPQFTYHNLSGNAGLAFSPQENLNFGLNISRSARTPNPAELFADGLHHSASIIERGNLAIKPEQVNQASLSVDGRWDVLKGLKVELNPYYLFSNTFINQVPTGVMVTIRGVFPVWDYQQIKARMLGLDADVELKLTDFMKWNSQFSMVKGDDLTHNEPLILMAPTQFRNALEFSFPKFRNTYLKVENHYTAHQNRYPLRNVGISIIQNGQLIEEELDISTPPAAYSLWNFSAGTEVFKNMEINLSMQNAFNKEYREYLNRLRLFAPEMGRNIIVSLKYKF